MDGTKPRVFGKGFVQSLIAVVAGNIVYLLIEPHLPPRGRHTLYRIDWGLAVDFWICLMFYGLLALLPPFKRR